MHLEQFDNSVNYIQMLKAIMVVYTIKTGMSNIWQLSLNPSMVEAVTTAVGNSFHGRIAAHISGDRHRFHR
jgi:ABC-type sulfate transport system permease component